MKPKGRGMEGFCSSAIFSPQSCLFAQATSPRKFVLTWQCCLLLLLLVGTLLSLDSTSGKAEEEAFRERLQRVVPRMALPNTAYFITTHARESAGETSYTHNEIRSVLSEGFLGAPLAIRTVYGEYHDEFGCVMCAKSLSGDGRYPDGCDPRGCQTGLTLAHYRVWRDIVQRNVSSAFVFEDDVLFHDDFHALFRAYWAALPEDFQVVWLGQYPVGVKVSCQRLAWPWPLRPEKALALWDSSAIGYTTHALIISQSGARLLLQGFDDVVAKHGFDAPRYSIVGDTVYPSSSPSSSSVTPSVRSAASGTRPPPAAEGATPFDSSAFAEKENSLGIGVEGEADTQNVFAGHDPAASRLGTEKAPRRNKKKNNGNGTRQTGELNGSGMDSFSARSEHEWRQQPRRALAVQSLLGAIPTLAQRILTFHPLSSPKTEQTRPFARKTPVRSSRSLLSNSAAELEANSRRRTHLSAHAQSASARAVAPETTPLSFEEVKIDFFMIGLHKTLSARERRQWLVQQPTRFTLSSFGGRKWCRDAPGIQKYFNAEITCETASPEDVRETLPVFGTGLVYQNYCRRKHSGIGRWRSQDIPVTVNDVTHSTPDKGQAPKYG